VENLSEITLLLRDLGRGESASFDELVPLVYDEMQQLARRQLGNNRDDTLNTQALVHEAFLKLNEGQEWDVINRNQFLRVCSVVMRNVVIDGVRKRKSAKRGGGEKALTFDEEIFKTETQSEELLALDEALFKLEEYDPVLARVVECRYFTGLTDAETGGALKISERTVRRHWTKARVLLHQMLIG
jgi:RNA polymerase sigma factor (TIGR02999 family)